MKARERECGIAKSDPQVNRLPIAHKAIPIPFRFFRLLRDSLSGAVQCGLSVIETRDTCMNIQAKAR